MKTIILFLLLLPFVCNGQVHSTKNLFSLWGEYLDDCNKLMADTMIQNGTVSIKYVPVLLNGEVNHFKLTPIDTTWTKCECQEYAQYGSRDKLTIGSWYNSNSNVLSRNLSLTDVQPATFYSKPTQNIELISITRKKICMIKQRKATWEDFWDRWLVEKSIIKIN